VAKEPRSTWRRLLKRISGALDEALPRSPEEQQYEPDSDEVTPERRRLRLRTLEKEGKGGYR
jgi:hypothetical protein